MIPYSPSWKVGMVIASVAIHSGFAYAIFSKPKIEIAGGSTAMVEARLGNSFADLADGADVPSVTKTPGHDPVETTMPKLPQETARSKPLEIITPQLAEPSVTVPMPVEAIPPQSALANAAPAPATPTPPEAALAQNTDTAMTPQTPSPATPPIEHAMAAPITPDAAQPAPDTLSAQEEDPIKESPRPAKRPERPTRDVLRQEARPNAQGNSNRNAVAGSAAGNNTAKATQQSTNSGRSSANGNAAASNYPGQVMRAIQRVRKPRVGSHGLALVGFAIGGNGGLQSVGISRSSGSARLDREALKIVQKASPFPAPPVGAQRRYRIEIEFRR